jgi:PilZ domain-containing protein
MPFEEFEVTEAQLLQRQRSESFGARTAKRIRAAENCLFSLLPYEELSRRAAGWYEACAQGMLRGNYAPIDAWIRSQSRIAMAEGFTPQDLLQLLLICRNSAIEVERWNEELLSTIEEVINEVLVATRTELAWNFPEKMAYPAHEKREANANGLRKPVEEKAGERRSFERNRLRLPIRVCGTGNHGQMEEITHTQSISRGGLYFVTREDYREGQILKITYPYWTESGGINSEYRAKIVRLDRLSEGAWGIAVEFLQNLGRKAN